MAARKRRHKFAIPKGTVAQPWSNTDARVWAMGANCKPYLWLRSVTDARIKISLERKYTTFGIVLYALRIIDSNGEHRCFTYDNMTPSKAKRLADKDLKQIGFLCSDDKHRVMV